jgi:bacillaene synthase trans-acting acyltransferase
MGKPLYNQSGAFKEWLDILDEIARPLLHGSVINILYHSNKKISDVFSQTLYTHPAIFMVEYSLFKFLEEQKVYPGYVLGFSLGEFASAAVANILSFEEALKMVIKHAEFIDKKCEKGSMLAILDNLDYFDRLKSNYPDIELASINNEKHFVISGNGNSLKEIVLNLKEQQIIYQTLPVSHAFHSSLIDPAAQEFKDYLKQFTFKKPSIPYISCERASFIEEQSLFSNDYFWNVTRKTILLADTISFTAKRGGFNYLDLGPSGITINFLKMNLGSNSNSQFFPGFTPFGGDLTNLNKIISSLKDNN